jgi:hypothetical protein
MGIIIAFILCIAVVFIAPMLISRAMAHEKYDSSTDTSKMVVPRVASMTNWGVRIVFSVIAVSLVFGTSLITVGDNEIAQMKRIYGGDLPAGKIIGMGNQKGKKAEVIGPGFHFVFGLNVLNDVEKQEMITVPAGFYRTLSAKDGKPLPQGVTYAPDFGAELNSYLDATAFLQSSDPNIGFKGPQTTILPPGTHWVNTYLWTVSDNERATNIAQGFVGVIKSNTKTSVNFGANMVAAYPDDCDSLPVPTSRGEGGLSVSIKPTGCVGIWGSVLPPGKYYVNEYVFAVTPIDTRVQAWEYKGGYLSRAVDLSVDAKGEITQAARSVQVDKPEGAADEAVGIKIDGYTIHQSLRVLVQVTPENAPFIVASVGGLDEVENRIITPVVQSAVRDLSGQFITVTEAVIDSDSGKPVLDENGNAVTRQSRRPVSPLDLIERRGVLQAVAEEQIKPEGDKAGVTIREVRFLQPDMPPEVLIPRKRRQLAFEMIETLQREQEAQIERIAKENAQATAEAQPELVAAEIAVDVAKQYKQERLLRGEADRNYLEQVAAGQDAQANVLGKELVAKLKMMELILDNPEALQHLGKTVPNIVVMSGDGAGAGGIGSLEGFAAVLSGSGVLGQNLDPKSAKVAQQ